MKKHIFIITFGLLLIGLVFFSQCQKTLDNKMVLYPVPDDPTISFRIWIKAGSQNDPVGKEGLAVMTASLLTEGSTQKHSYEEILEQLYPLAAQVNSQIDKEMTIIYGRTHKDNLETYYQILKEIIQEPAFKQEDFTRVKTDLQNYLEKTLRYANDEELGKEVLSEFAFRNSPYQHIEEGHLSSLQAITLEDVIDFYHRFYHRNQIMVGLGGGYPPDFARQVYDDFQTLADNPATPAPELKPEQIEGLQIQIIEKAANATAISFGFPLNVVRGSKDYYALAVANSWLGEHRNSSSHLYQVIREARGLNYGDYSYIEHFPNGGRWQFPPANVARRQQMFQIWIRPVPNPARLFAFRAALGELQKLVDNGLNEEEFALTKKFLKNYVLHFAPTTMMKLGYAMDDRFYEIQGSHLQIFREMIDKITRQEVNQAIKKHLQYQNLKVVFVTDQAESLKDMLINNAESPISYDSPKSQEILDADKVIAAYPLKIAPENVEIITNEKVFQ